jgi:branched-chain amino acid transport system permease protein
LATFLDQIFNAATLGSIYLLVALGITLVYGLARVVNFAQGELVVLGAFVTYALVRAGLTPILAILAATLAVGAGSEILEVGLFRRTIVRPFSGFVISLGLILALEGIYALIWPGPTYSIRPLIAGIWRPSGLLLDENNALLIIITVVVALLLAAILHHTQIGRSVRAIAEDRTATQVLGVPITAYTAAVFVIGSMLAALAGGMLGSFVPFNSYSGTNFLLEAFAVAIIGGLGNVRGAMIAAAVLAVAETMGSAYVSLAWGPDIGLLTVIAIILKWPHGVLRGTEAGETLGASEEAVAIARDQSALREHAAAGSPAARAGAGGSAHLHRALARIASAPGARDTRERPDATASLRRLGWAATIVLAVILPLLMTSASVIYDAQYAGVIAIAAYSAWFLFRYAGIPSMAQAALMGVGAYTAALCAARLGLGFWPELACAVLIAAGVAFIMGFVSMRTTGSYFLIAIFAFSQLAVDVANNWQGLTGGAGGLTQATAPAVLGSLVNFAGPRQMLWLVLAALALTVAVLAALGRSAFGRRLTAIRDNELLAQSLGLGTFWQKVIAFTVSGAFAGLAGVLFLYQESSIQPSLFGVFDGVNLLLVIFLGGAGTLLGPTIGAVIFVFLPTVLNLGPNQNQIVDGLLLVAIIVALPIGIGGSLVRGYWRGVRTLRSARIARGGQRSLRWLS